MYGTIAKLVVLGSVRSIHAIAKKTDSWGSMRSDGAVEKNCCFRFSAVKQRKSWFFWFQCDQAVHLQKLVECGQKIQLQKPIFGGSMRRRSFRAKAPFGPRF